MRLDLFCESDQIITVDKLRHPVTKAYINDASVTAEIREDDDTTVVNNGITLDYVADSDGQYVGSSDVGDTELVEGDYYYVRITVVSTEGTTTFKKRARAKYYEGC